MNGPYMTPGRFRIGGFGVDLTDIDDVDLRAILNRATAMVNAYCTVPSTPAPYDFRGGTVVGDEVPYHVGSALLPPQTRVYPRHTPLRSLTSIQIDVTPGQHVAFDEEEVYTTTDYFELTSHAFTGLSPIGNMLWPGIGMQTPVVKVSYTYGYLISEIGEELEQTDAKQYRAMNQWWFADPAPVVYVDGVEADSADYTVGINEGTVTFDTNQPDGAIVSVDYAHKMPAAIAEATGMVAKDALGERDLNRKGLHGLVELAVGEVRIRRDFPRAGVQKVGVSDQVAQLLDPYKFITVRGGTDG
jgi:hypothetical protein